MAAEYISNFPQKGSSLEGSSQPFEGANRAFSGPGSSKVVDDLARLLGPLVPEVLRGPGGSLDLAKIPAKDFAEFKQFLAAQAGLNSKVSIGFLYIVTAPYKKLLEDEKFLPLFKLLYRQFNPHEFVSLPESEAEELLKEFQRELIAIDAKSFAQSQLSSSCGRDRLSKLLTDSKGLPDSMRADLIRGITHAMKDQGRLSDLEYGQVVTLSPLGAFQALDFFSLFYSKQGLDPATQGALSLIESAAFFENEAEARKKDFQDRPELQATLILDEKLQTIDAKKLEHFTQLAQEKLSQGDLASRAQGQLAELWLMAANRRNWDASLVGKDVDSVRAHIMARSEAFIARAGKLETRLEFENFTNDLIDFLEAEVDPDHAGLDIPLQKLIQKLPSDQRGAYDQLKHLADTWQHSIEMGEWITVRPARLKMREENLRNQVALMIQGLEQTKHDLWYGYKQHKLASRAGSAIADQFNGGDRQDIREANREINQLIYQLSEAESEAELAQVGEQLFASLKEDSALFKGLKASSMNFDEQLIGLGQTIAIMAALGLATRGLSLLGQGGINLLRSAGVIRGAAVAETATAAAATTVETATVAERVVNGFKLGAQISLAENAVAVASNEVRQGPETVEGWTKDALATGTSMAFTGLLPISHAAQGNLLKNVWTRYTANTARGLKFLAMDTAAEAIEEGIDDLARRAMDGDFMPIDPTHARDILALSLAGGGLKVGTAAEIIKGSTKKIPSPLAPARQGISGGGEGAPGGAGEGSPIKHKPPRPHPLTNPLLSPAALFLGTGGIGGSGIVSTNDDPHLRNLEQSLRDLQDKNPNDPAIQSLFAVVADRLQELGDPRGTWIALELKRQKLLSQNAVRNEVFPIQKEIESILNNIHAEILEKFGLSVDYRFDPMKGFHLRLSGVANDSAKAESFARFLNGGYGSFLTGLKLSAFQDTTEWLPNETNLKCLAGLRELEIINSPYYVEDHLHSLLQSAALSHLRLLNLHGNNLGDGEVRRIAASPIFRNLRSLDLAANLITNEGSRAIAESENLGNLQTLDLRWWTLRGIPEVAAVQGILQSPRLPNLIEFNGQKINRDLGSAEIDLDEEQDPPSSDPAGRAFTFAGPAFPVIETLCNGQPSPIGMLLGGLTTLATAGMMSGIFSRMADWVRNKHASEGTLRSEETFALGFNSDSQQQNESYPDGQADNSFSLAEDQQGTNSEINSASLPSNPNYSRLLDNPFLAPFWLFLGAGGIGGPGVKSRSPVIDDSRLRRLDESILALQVKSSRDTQIQTHFAVIADRLQELGDSRGDWIVLELERQRLLPQEEQKERLATIEAEIRRIKEETVEDIRKRFGASVDLNFEVEKGFNLALGMNNPSLDPIDFLERFTASEYGYLLRGLSIKSFELAHDESQWIANAQGFCNLTSLHLGPNSIGVQGARSIAASSVFRNLTSLNLGGNDIGVEGARSLAASPVLHNLTSLDLSVNRIGVEGARAIASSPVLHNLRSLNLGINNIGAEGARAIAASKVLHNLTSLNLEVNDIRAEGARSIATSPVLHNLISLNLGVNEIGVDGVRSIAASPVLRNLNSLSLGTNRIGDEGTQAIADSPFLNLISLDLQANQIGSEGARSIAVSPVLRNLTYLNLRFNRLGSEGARSVATSPVLHNLTVLDLLDNYIGTEAARALEESPDLPNLIELNGRKIDRPGPQSLKAFAAPALFGLDYLLNGQPTLTGALMAGLATLASAGMMAGIFSRMSDWVKRMVSGEEKQNFLDSAEDLPITSPLFIDDPLLRNLDASLLELQVKDPKDPEIQNQIAVISDRLQEIGDPRGECIALKLEQFRLRSQEDSWKSLEPINAQLQRIREKIIGDIRNEFGLNAEFYFSVESGGFGLFFSSFRSDGEFPSPFELLDFLERFTSSRFAYLFRELHIIHSEFEPDQVHRLLSNPGLSSLTFLKLSSNNLGVEGARTIADSPILGNLTSLTLWDDRIGVHGVRALAESSNLRKLTSLSLKENGIGDEGARVIAESPAFQRLTSLDIIENDINNEGGRALASSQALHNLASLNLSDNNIDAETLRAIESPPNLPNLIELNGEKLNRPLGQADDGGPEQSGPGSLHAFAPLAGMLGIDFLAHHGQFTSEGVFLAGLASLASAWMALGIYSKGGNKPELSPYRGSADALQAAELQLLAPNLNRKQRRLAAKEYRQLLESLPKPDPRFDHGFLTLLELSLAQEFLLTPEFVFWLTGATRDTSFSIGLKKHLFELLTILAISAEGKIADWLVVASLPVQIIALASLLIVGAPLIVLYGMAVGLGLMASMTLPKSVGNIIKRRTQRQLLFTLLEAIKNDAEDSPVEKPKQTIETQNVETNSPRLRVTAQTSDPVDAVAQDAERELAAESEQAAEEAGQESKSGKNPGKVHAFAAPALFGLDYLVNGQPTLAGTIFAGLATLASGGMVSGFFKRFQYWFQEKKLSAEFRRDVEVNIDSKTNFVFSTDIAPPEFEGLFDPMTLRVDGNEVSGVLAKNFRVHGWGFSPGDWLRFINGESVFAELNNGGGFMTVSEMATGCSCMSWQPKRPFSQKPNKDF